MSKHIVDFCREESGLTMVEYAVAGSLITLACVTAFTNLGFAVYTRITLLAAAVLL
jgi:pilus assembly protein Flp/PilA